MSGARATTIRWIGGAFICVFACLADYLPAQASEPKERNHIGFFLGSTHTADAYLSP